MYESDDGTLKITAKSLDNGRLESRIVDNHVDQSGNSKVIESE